MLPTSTITFFSSPATEILNKTLSRRGGGTERRVKQALKEIFFLFPTPTLLHLPFALTSSSLTSVSFFPCSMMEEKYEKIEGCNTQLHIFENQDSAIITCNVSVIITSNCKCNDNFHIPKYNCNLWLKHRMLSQVH